MFGRPSGTPVILAHAFGARYDLPIPLLVFVLGGAAVVLLSFVLVMRLAVTPRADDVPRADDGATIGAPSPVWGALSVLGLVFLIWVGFAGSQEVSENLLPTTFWLLAWIAVPLTCGLLGNWTRPVNPFRFLAQMAGSPRARRALLGREAPLRWRGGWWPAVVLFFLAACSELIFNLTMTIPHNIALALTAYAIVSTIAGLLFGDSWLARGELFTVLYDTWGRLGRFRFGAPGRNAFGGGLGGGFEPTVSRITFVLLLLLSVNFDGLLATPKWTTFETRLGYGPVHADALHTFRVVTFVVLAVVLGLAFFAFARWSARAGRHRERPLTSFAGLLSSLLPIAFGYLLVHNLQYTLVNSQLMLPLLGNPLGGGHSWPITLPYPFDDSYEVHTTFLPSSFYWYVGVIVIVAVHVIAVVLAHRHLAVTGATQAAARRSEYPWLVA
ncbi:MAG: hypothetical protein QOI42_1988, partial [Frankiaceae bacterium]|nr:hypothetical protein [Frankiaceae bacterium]